MTLAVKVIFNQSSGIRVKHHRNPIANLDVLEVNALSSISSSTILNLVDLAARDTQLNKLGVTLRVEQVIHVASFDSDYEFA